MGIRDQSVPTPQVHVDSDTREQVGCENFVVGKFSGAHNCQDLARGVKLHHETPNIFNGALFLASFGSIVLHLVLVRIVRLVFSRPT